MRAGTRSAGESPRRCSIPAWEILPHEGKLPHADVISDRLQTLVALADKSATVTIHTSAIVVTSVAALLQKTFPRRTICKSRTRRLQRGDKIAPLDLIEFLEEQGYEPEAQVSQKGEIALRGGIVDVFPPTSPWPVRLEFFGDELESLRYFDPLTQISREEISEVTLPPAGELGILKQVASDENGQSRECHSRLATLLDHLPRETIFLLCEPESLAVHAEDYAQQIPPDDPFFISWPDFLAELNRRGFTSVELSDDADNRLEPDSAIRPIRASAETSTRSTPFVRWPNARRNRKSPRRSGANFSSNSTAGCGRIMPSTSFATTTASGSGLRKSGRNLGQFAVQVRSQTKRHDWTSDACPTIHLGSLARGFICDEAKLVVVTDAEIFGRYKIQRPRRLKSPHALAARSALDIDFTDLEEGDLVVHLQHGIGRYLGLKNLPASCGAIRQSATATRAIRNRMPRHRIRAQPAPAMSRRNFTCPSARRISSANTSARARRIRRSTRSAARAGHKAKEQAESAVRDVAAELLRIQAVRETQPGHACKPDTPWQREFESAFIYEETPDQITAIAETKADMERAKPMDRLICGDVGFGKTEVAIRAAFKARDGRQTSRRCSCRRPFWRSSISTISASAWRIIRCASNCSRASARSASRQRVVQGSGQRRGGHRHRHAPASCRTTSRSRTSAWS